MRKIKIIAVSGPSGSGKTTIAKAMLERFEKLSFSVSATTRPIRENETDGKDYYFLGQDEFSEQLKKNELIEFQEVYPGLLYGTLKSEISRISREKKTALLDVDVKGALNIKKIYGLKAFIIFVHPGSIEILKNRLKKRKSEDALSLEARLKRSALEFSYANEFDSIVMNDGRIEKAIIETEKLISHLIDQS